MNTPRFQACLQAAPPRQAALFEDLRALWRALESCLRRDFNRTLPFADYLVDRWEKAQTLGFGEGSSIYDSALVLGDVRVGAHSWIGPGALLDGSGGLSIGSYCSISAGAQIYSHDSVAWSLSGGESPMAYAPTRIGDRCYLGPNVIVAKGVTIGDGCVIGANSLVLRDIPPNSKAFGSPCRVVGPADGERPSGSPAPSDN
ncbi:MAG: acyltransferase [Vampirovibrionales bacterium]|nr:acyltransferase [Vampirovibrionales bacterium]